MDDDIKARMHTAEHLLNQCMDRRFGCGRCFSMHLGRKKSKCDYHFERDLTDQEIAAIETEVNDVIAADLGVSVSQVSRQEAEAKYFTGKLPAHVTGDIRIVWVGDYDACPCIGAHVDRTGRIGAFHITTHSHATDRLRIRFKLSSASAS